RDIHELQQLSLSDHVFKLSEPHLSHVLPYFLGDEEEKIDDVLRLACEFFAELGVLSRHADRTGVQMTDPHHDAPGGNQRPSGETELLRPEQCCDDNIAAGLELSIRLYDHAS